MLLIRSTILEITGSVAGGRVVFPVHRVQLSLPVPKYPALHTTKVIDTF